MDGPHSLSLAGLLLLSACAAGPVPGEPGLVVPLAAAPNNAGSVGRATLLPTLAGSRIDLFFTGAGPSPTLPLHVYTYLYEGACAQLPATPAIALNERVLVRTGNGNLGAARRGAFTLSHEVPMPLAELASGRYALALRSTPADGGALLYCGELRRA